jgi:hypothetical protein
VRLSRYRASVAGSGGQSTGVRQSVDASLTLRTSQEKRSGQVPRQRAPYVGGNHMWCTGWSRGCLDRGYVEVIDVAHKKHDAVAPPPDEVPAVSPSRAPPPRLEGGVVAFQHSGLWMSFLSASPVCRRIAAWTRNKCPLKRRLLSATRSSDL